MGNYPGAINTISATTNARVAAAAFFNSMPEEVSIKICQNSFMVFKCIDLQFHIGQDYVLPF